MVHLTKKKNNSYSNWKRYWDLRFKDPLSDAETLIFDDKGYITELGKKPVSYDQIKGQYTGLIKVRADDPTPEK